MKIETIEQKKIRLGQLVAARTVAEKILYEHEDTKPTIKAGRRHNQANMLAIAEHRLTQQRLYNSMKELQAQELYLTNHLIEVDRK